jgi:hypothetical protein
MSDSDKDEPEALSCDVLEPESAIKGEEELKELEPEIDVRTDPFDLGVSSKPDCDWERMIKEVKVREPKPPSEKKQRERIQWILRVLKEEKSNPLEEQVKEALGWIRDIGELNPNHEQFVAADFSHYYPAWHELLKGVRQRSARAVLS